jgi:hypothetical protein
MKGQPMPNNEEEIPLTGDPKVDAALTRIRGKFQDLEDAMLVQSILEKKQGERLKEHAQFIEKHETIMGRIETAMLEMTEKVNFLLNQEMKRGGGAETQGL